MKKILKGVAICAMVMMMSSGIVVASELKLVLLGVVNCHSDVMSSTVNENMADPRIEHFIRQLLMHGTVLMDSKTKRSVYESLPDFLVRDALRKSKLTMCFKEAGLVSIDYDRYNQIEALNNDDLTYDEKYINAGLMWLTDALRKALEINNPKVVSTRFDSPKAKDAITDLLQATVSKGRLNVYPEYCRLMEFLRDGTLP